MAATKGAQSRGEFFDIYRQLEDLMLMADAERGAQQQAEMHGMDLKELFLRWLQQLTSEN